MFPVVDQPPELKIELHLHQLHSIYRMEELERHKIIKTENCVVDTTVGINSDIAGYGKCLKKGTKILLFSGEIKNVEDITTNDILMGDDSNPRKVLSLARGKEQLYTVIQRHGENYSVNESHILTLNLLKNKFIKRKKGRYHLFYFDTNSQILYKWIYLFYPDCILHYNKLPIENNKKIDISLLKYLSIHKNAKSLFKGYRNCVEFPDVNTVIHPYLAGLFLHLDAKEYIINSKSKRLQYLAGILDRYGVYYKGFFRIYIDNQILAHKILFLCYTLGFNAYKNNNAIVLYTDNPQELPLLTLIVDNEKHPKYPLYSPITITKDKVDDYYGFVIDGNSRFLLGDCTVTHNTLSMIGLILRNKMSWIKNNNVLQYQEINDRHILNNYMCNKLFITKRKINNTLILVNDSLVSQWMREFSYSPLKVQVISQKRFVNKIDIDNYQVILCTPKTFNDIASTYNDYCWKRFIFDEPGHIKVPAMKEIYAGFMWFVTATPEKIYDLHKLSHSSVMKSIFSYNYQVMQKYFKPIIVQNNNDFVIKSYKMPPTTHLTYKCHSVLYNMLNGIIGEQILTMIRTNNISSLIETLGGDRTNNILDVVKDTKNKELQILDAELIIATIKKDNDKITKINESKKRIQDQIIEIEKRFANVLNRECTICFSDLINPVMEPNCQNIFCSLCLFQWLQNSMVCPLCRTQVKSDKLVYITESKEDNSVKEERLKTKEETILEIIKNKKDGKFILFSSDDQSFSFITKILVQNNITFNQVRNRVDEIIKAYKSGTIKVLFINTTQNVTGLNLIETTDIINYHEMDESTYKQIIGRANRIGRTIPLTVHNLTF